MLRKFRKLLQDDTPPPEDPEERIRVATCVLLLEVANIDQEFSDEERAHLFETIRGRFNLGREEAEELVDTARAAREGSVDLWQFTHSINEHFGIPEKVQIIEEIWRMVCADGMLDAHEDHLMRRLSHLLNLTHAQLIESKLKVFDEYRNREA